MLGSHKPFSRRELMRLTAAGSLGLATSGWVEALANSAPTAATPGKKRKSCIVIWLDGGPSHIDTWDPKPDGPADNRGEYKAVQTSVPGILVSEGLEKIGQHMKHGVLVRGMSTNDNNHPTGRMLMHTGFKMKEGGLDHPTLGSFVSHELGDPAASLPNFVMTGMQVPYNVRRAFMSSPGFLGAKYAPLIADNPDKGLSDVKAAVPDAEFGEKLTLLQQVEGQFLKTNQSTPAEAHKSILERSIALMRSSAVKAFDLSQEPADTAKNYGTSHFGRSVLLARRLVEVGVPFVEVYLPEWDTHTPQRANAIKTQTMPALDLAVSTLIGDLKTRGTLDDTLVVVMGEFGRTPKCKPGGGRDHFSRAFSVALFGGGIKGGQVIGKTDAGGAAVTERPTSIADLMASICMTLGINPDKEIETRGARPARIVNKGYKLLSQML